MGKLKQGKNIFDYNRAKRITLGERTVIVSRGQIECDYSGELDQDGNACGHGLAVCKTDQSKRWEGTWLKNKTHGISM